MDADFDAVPDANREYKDSVFTLLFGTKDVAVEVSNAIFGTNYGPDTEVAFTTLKNVLCRGRHNDLSFVLDGKLVVLIEHQSTINENMPLRMLFYIAKVYHELSKKENLYSRSMFTIPQPVFVVFHNGVDDMPEDIRELRLSDMFAKSGAVPDNVANLELVVTVYNINKGRNPEIAGRSPTLDGYETFIAMIRENRKTMSLEDAIKKAVLDCIDQNILKTFLSKLKQEVVGMLLDEWKLDEEVAVARRESWEEGLGIGMKRERLAIARKMKTAGRSVNEIVEMTDISVDDVLRL